MSDNSRIGVWLIGAKGGIATTLLAGLCALRLEQPSAHDGCESGIRAPSGSTPPSGQRGPGTPGLLTTLPQFAGLAMPDWDALVAGGHEIRAVPLADEARRLVTESRTVAPELWDRCRPQLDEIDRRIRPGTVLGAGGRIAAMADAGLPPTETPRAAVERLRADIEEFARREKLAHVVVVNVASTEPTPGETWPSRWSEMEKLLDRGDDCRLPASSLYAIAAILAGCSYINFTPSLGPAPEAIDELARHRATRYYGCDGKTGETLMKSVLAPMFAARNLHVMSWVGHNIFGNMDAQVLADPDNKQAKVASKDHLLGEILGYRPQTHVSIECIDSLGDWKTAWDHIHFQGFLGVPMVLQFTWQGCDSILAAPLVLDLVRLCEAARRRGHVGRMTFLASFFKSPYGVAEQRFDRQFQMLEQWAVVSG
jgi:myo-inositol-1-phosphate synthase